MLHIQDKVMGWMAAAIDGMKILEIFHWGAYYEISPDVVAALARRPVLAAVHIDSRMRWSTSPNHEPYYLDPLMPFIRTFKYEFRSLADDCLGRWILWNAANIEHIDINFTIPRARRVDRRINQSIFASPESDDGWASVPISLTIKDSFTRDNHVPGKIIFFDCQRLHSLTLVRGNVLGFIERFDAEYFPSLKEFTVSSINEGIWADLFLRKLSTRINGGLSLISIAGCGAMVHPSTIAEHGSCLKVLKLGGDARTSSVTNSHFWTAQDILALAHYCPELEEMHVTVAYGDHMDADFLAALTELPPTLLRLSLAFHAFNSPPPSALDRKEVEMMAVAWNNKYRIRRLLAVQQGFRWFHVPNVGRPLARSADAYSACLALSGARALYEHDGSSETVRQLYENLPQISSLDQRIWSEMSEARKKPAMALLESDEEDEDEEDKDMLHEVWNKVDWSGFETFMI